MKKAFSLLKSFFIIVSVAALISGATQAAFTDTATNPGNVFTTGTADLKFLNSLAYGTYEPSRNGFYMTNAECDGVCEDSVPGITFDNIFPGWTGQSLLKVANKGSLNLTLSATAVQTGGNATLGDWITVAIYRWNDMNKDGIVDAGEEDGVYAGGAYTMSQWFSSTPFTDLGQINRINGENEVRGFIFKFEVHPDIPEEYQGSSMTVDFEMNGTTTGAPQGPTP